jgi:hypothetical protein
MWIIEAIYIHFVLMRINLTARTNNLVKSAPRDAIVILFKNSIRCKPISIDRFESNVREVWLARLYRYASVMIS